jgi:hypothetical protein
VVRPLVGRVVLLGRRAHRDQADDAVVGPCALGQLGGEGPVGVGVDGVSLEPRRVPVLPPLVR